MRKNNVRKTKTDKIDTLVIAKTLMMQDDLRFITFFDFDMMDLKVLGFFRQKATKQTHSIKNPTDNNSCCMSYYYKSNLYSFKYINPFNS